MAGAAIGRSLRITAEICNGGSLADKIFTSAVIG